MGAHDVLRKPFIREVITVLTSGLEYLCAGEKVRTRRLMTGRLLQRVADIERLIAEGRRNDPTPSTHSGASARIRQLNIKSVAALGGPLTGSGRVP